MSKVVGIVDAICDCLPGVSLFTNGAQYLYKSARKTDQITHKMLSTQTSNWKTEVKIHVINKSKFECIIGMIPIIGNLTRLITFIMDGLRDELMYSIINGKDESTRLYLQNHNLNEIKNEERACAILISSSLDSTFDIFSLILTSRNWSVSSCLRAFNMCLKRNPTKSIKDNALLLLDHLKDELIKKENSETLTTLLDLLSKDQKKDYEDIKEKLEKIKMSAEQI